MTHLREAEEKKRRNAALSCEKKAPRREALTPIMKRALKI